MGAIVGGAVEDRGGNLDADPAFVSAYYRALGRDGLWPTEDDGLRLSTGSPCVDAGSAHPAAATDVLGVARPQGQAFDLGAYEGAFPKLTFEKRRFPPVFPDAIQSGLPGHPVRYGDE